MNNSSSVVEALYGSGLSVVGVNHTTLPISQRELLTKFSEQVEAIYDASSIVNGVVISTCNRFELVTSNQESSVKFEAFLRNKLGLTQSLTGVYWKKNREAVAHLFRVVSSLDSMVVGETQIVGQVKNAYLKAKALGYSDKLLHHLFQFSFNLSKRVKNYTGLGSQGLSVSYVAVQLAAQIFDDISKVKVLVIGSGQMAELVLVHLKARGCRSIVIANRTVEKASLLASRFEGSAISIDEIELYLHTSDLIVGSIQAEAPIVTKKMLKQIRRNSPLFFIDLGVPRNFSSNLVDVSDVYLYDIDHIGDFIAKNKEVRTEAANDAELIIEFGILQFEKWLARLKAEPESLRFRAYIKSVCDAELRRTLNKTGLVLEPSRTDELVHRISQKISHRLVERAIADSDGQPVGPDEMLTLLFDDILQLD
jgi:glutamyl-tRNA reductase